MNEGRVSSAETASTLRLGCFFCVGISILAWVVVLTFIWSIVKVLSLAF